MIAFGTSIIAAGWRGPHELGVQFASSHSGALHQLYAGRTLIGVTGRASERVVSGQLRPEITPCPLSVVAVSPALRFTDHGQLLARRPWNRHRLTWTAPGLTDCDRFVITGADDIETDPDDANWLGSVPYHGTAAAYTFETPAVARSGEWRFGVTPYDTACGPDALNPGNAGTETVGAVLAQVAPPDVAFVDGRRFAVAVAAGTAAITISYREE